MSIISLSVNITCDNGHTYSQDLEGIFKNDICFNSYCPECNILTILKESGTSIDFIGGKHGLLLELRSAS